MTACESFHKSPELDVTLVGTCAAMWLRMPSAKHVKMHGPATIRGGALQLMFGNGAQSLHLDSLLFDGAGSDENLLDNYAAGIPNVTITNTTFFNWTGASVLRFNAKQGTYNARIQNVTMYDIVGAMIDAKNMESLHIEDVSCENCAHAPGSPCASIQMEWCSDALVFQRTSCNRPQKKEPMHNHCLVDPRATSDTDGYGVTVFSNVHDAIDAADCRKITVRSTGDDVEEGIEIKRT